MLTRYIEPGGWISWGEIDYSCFKIVRTEDGKDVEDNMSELLEMIGTLGGTRPNWTADEFVKPSRRYTSVADIYLVGH